MGGLILNLCPNVREPCVTRWRSVRLYEDERAPILSRALSHAIFLRDVLLVNRAITLHTLDEERVQFVRRSEDDHLSACATALRRLPFPSLRLVCRPSAEQQHCKIAVTPKTTKCRLSHWMYKRQRRNTATADHRL